MVLHCLSISPTQFSKIRRTLSIRLKYAHISIIYIKSHIMLKVQYYLCSRGGVVETYK